MMWLQGKARTDDMLSILPPVAILRGRPALHVIVLGCIALAGCAGPAARTRVPPPPVLNEELARRSAPPSTVLPPSCTERLAALGIAAEPLPDVAHATCPQRNIVRIDRLTTARLSDPAVMTCPVAERLAILESTILQPGAMKLFGQPVATIDHWGTFNCKRMTGNPGRMSEHASANAIDIHGLTLADGRRLSVERDWRRNSPEGGFLFHAAQAACTLFHVVITPDGDAAHRAHLHLDAGRWKKCDMRFDPP